MSYDLTAIALNFKVFRNYLFMYNFDDYVKLITFVRRYQFLFYESLCKCILSLIMRLKECKTLNPIFYCLTCKTGILGSQIVMRRVKSVYTEIKQDDFVKQSVFYLQTYKNVW